MIIADLAKEVKSRKGYDSVPLADLEELLRDSFETLTEMAIENKVDFYFQVPKFGVFKILRLKERSGFNPIKKEKIAIPAKLAFKFRVSPKLKERVAALDPGKAVEKPKKAKPKKQEATKKATANKKKK